MNYNYHALSVPGGGFVTGFVFHDTQENLLYCRTDIGGVYRYDFEQNSWHCLIDDVKDTEVYKTYPLSIALDKAHPNRLYMAVGLDPDYAIGVSEDYGKSFEYKIAPGPIHGNAPGRSTGERLMVDPFNSEVVYLGTLGGGLYRSLDRCQSFTKVPVGPFDEKNIAFVAADEKAGNIEVLLDGKKMTVAKRIFVATSGENGSKDGNVRGPSIYVSNDGGVSFEVLEAQPEPLLEGPKDHPGYVGQHIAFDEKYVYITYAAYNIGWSSFDTYGCDTGLCYDGALYRYQIDEEGKVIEAKDITPNHPMMDRDSTKLSDGRRLGYGLSGIACDPNIEGAVILTTITSAPDVFYRSVDYGETFVPIMAGLEIGEINFKTSYQKPIYNGNASLIHWMADIKINPFNSDMALFNTGAGVFVTYNLTAMEKNQIVKFETLNEGIEETVHLNVYAPVSLDVDVIDVIGDYGMFLFKDVNEIPENTVADDKGNRWITAMNADFSDKDDKVIVATMRGNWTGLTKGGLVMSQDGGKSFEKLPYPQPINDSIDGVIESLKRPNLTSGWVALSADTKHLVWAIGLPLDGDLIVVSHDKGATYNKVNFYDEEGQLIHFNKQPVKVFSDRMVAERFFAFGDSEEGPTFFVSTDGGDNFKAIRGPKDFPKVLLAGIDSKQDIEIRGIPGREGAFVLAMLDQGLWCMEYEEDSSRFYGKRLTKEGDVVKRVGIGIGKDQKLNVLYISGTIDGEYGFYRSEDGARSFERINDDQHQYGDIRSIDGDKKVYGRFYIATGTRGLVCGHL